MVPRYLDSTRSLVVPLEIGGGGGGGWGREKEREEEEEEGRKKGKKRYTGWSQN